MRNRHYGWKSKIGITILLFSFIIMPISHSISMAAEGTDSGGDTPGAGGEAGAGVGANAGVGTGAGAAAAGAIGVGVAEGLSRMAVVGIATKVATSIAMMLFF